jgi:hypothetical protein
MCICTPAAKSSIAILKLILVAVEMPETQAVVQTLLLPLP